MGKQETLGLQEEPAWAEEVREWLDAMAAVLRFQGDERAGELLRRLQQFASRRAGHARGGPQYTLPKHHFSHPEPRYPGQAGGRAAGNLLR